jgi:hypothetical protein
MISVDTSIFVGVGKGTSILCIDLYLGLSDIIRVEIMGRRTAVR